MYEVIGKLVCDIFMALVCGAGFVVAYFTMMKFIDTLSEIRRWK